MPSLSEARTWSDIDRGLMFRALELASLGKGRVSPGPLVGCVIATPEGNVLGEGSYVYDEVKHAEIIALEQAGALARGATAYVSLEPHAHQARTGPCTAALIRAGIARVVAPIEDPNPKVLGTGFAHLRQSGVTVEMGLLAKEASRLNETYIHYVRTGRPFVHLKLAVSLDGRIATRNGDSRWITGEKSREAVQCMRSEYDGILVGIGTVMADDPSLTDRSEGNRRRPLTRIILDRSLRLPVTSKIARTARQWPVLIFTSMQSNDRSASVLTSCGIEVISISRDESPRKVLEQLGARSIQSVIIEGGATVAGAFCDAGLIDKVTFFIAPIIIGGATAPGAVGGLGASRISEAVRLAEVEIKSRGTDIEITGYPDQTAVA